MVELVDIVRDTFLWRRKRLRLATLLTSTAICVVVEVYRFSFATLASYVAVFIVALCLCVARCIGSLETRESSEVLSQKVLESVAVDFVNTIRGGAEKSVRWVFRVGAKGDWLTFAGVVTSLWSMLRIGLHFDLLILYLCVVLGLIALPLWVRYRGKIKVLKDVAKARCQVLYGILDEKVISKFSGASKTGGLEEKKEEKTE